ncbi:unnamed protein product [Microthlaspi erraticum]|uniref:DUF1216 domain-containing protein n=1 Tax=Microthlaspi erraticum TaxID=1685480 RepID=A0A6D2KVB9_9BRAS|nr:unnamed protein product [Microthlaspi erraticum]
MSRTTSAVCLLLLVALSAVYEVQGTFLLRHYLRKFPRRSRDFSPFACKGMLTFVKLLELKCPLKPEYRSFFGRLRSYMNFISSSSGSQNFDVELKSQAEGLNSAMSALGGGSSADNSNVLDTLTSMGKTLSAQTRSDSTTEMSLSQRKELIMSMAKWAGVIGKFVSTAASKSGTSIDISSLGIDGIDANMGSPSADAGGSPTSPTTGTGASPTSPTTGTGGYPTSPTTGAGGSTYTGSGSGTGGSNTQVGATASGGSPYNGGYNTQVEGTARGETTSSGGTGMGGGAQTAINGGGGVYDKLIRTIDDCVWHVDSSFHGRFTIDFEFLELKISPLNGGEASPVWPNDTTMQSISTQTTLKCLSRMLEESILSDVTIPNPHSRRYALRSQRHPLG